MYVINDDGSNYKIGIGDGYVAGKLYLFNQKYEILIYPPTEKDKKIFESFIYDKTTQNVHLLPLDPMLLKSCSESIADKREKIFNVLSTTRAEYIRKKKKGGIDGGGAATMYSKTNINMSLKLFQFIPLQYENIKYDLMFVRFFKCNMKVSCVLNSFQIKIYEKAEPRSLKYYPASGEDSMLYDENSVYYNFPVNFNESAEVIVEKLCYFIKECANKINECK